MQLSKLVPLASIVLKGAEATITPSCGTGCPLYSLVFNDEFDENAVNETKWNYRTDSKVKSTQSPNNVNVTDGIMYIKLTKLAQTDAHGMNYGGGGLISKENFHYGYYEASMKLSNNPAWHSSFWQMAGNGNDTYHPAQSTFTEFDTFEVNSNAPSSITHNVFLWTAPNPTPKTISYGFAKAAVDYSAEYHTFGTLWNENSVAFYTDGVLVKTVNYPHQTYPHDYLNMWLTCIAYNSATIDDTMLPNAIETDFVRFYQKDYYITATSLCRGYYQVGQPCASTAGYTETGSWTTSSLDGYTLALKSRYACQASGASASWSEKPIAGTYDVYAWNVVGPGSDQSAKFSVFNNGNPVSGSSQTVNQNTGASGWLSLASGLVVDGTQPIKVLLESSGQGCTRADTIKLVRTA